MSRMNDDELRALLSRRDPAADRPADAGSSPKAQALWESIMSTSVDERTSASRTSTPARPRRRMAMIAAAAAAVTAIGVGTAIIGQYAAPERTSPTASAMALRFQDSGLAEACAPFEVAFLQQMPVAFQGKVVETGDTSTVLRVDRWFRGGQDGVTTVRVSTPGPDNSESVHFGMGETYLVSARDGVVSSCGYTGGLTPEFLADYEKAFGAR